MSLKNKAVLIALSGARRFLTAKRPLKSAKIALV